MGAISLDLFTVLLGGATALVPVYARDILHAGPFGLGLLRSAPAVGAVLTALVQARHPPDRRVGHKLFAAVAVFGVATLIFAFSGSLALSLAAVAVLGASDMVSVNIRSSLIQLATPDAMRRRVSAVSMLFIGASSDLGAFESGGDNPAQLHFAAYWRQSNDNPTLAPFLALLHQRYPDFSTAPLD